MKFPVQDRKNSLFQVISGNRIKDTLYINQDAAVSLGNLVSGNSAAYQLTYPGNGIFIFNLSGEVSIDGMVLNPRDAAGITGTGELKINAQTDTDFILIEVPVK
jgi:redox-sensitive bicupin YhaK (pirin superfamily)